MQVIATKLTKVARHAPEGWTRDDVRHLIHGCGGSPRRAKRALRSEELVELSDGATVPIAQYLRDQFAADIAADVHFVHALKAANDRWVGLHPTAEPEDMDDEQLELSLSAPAKRLRHHVTGAIERGEKQPVVEQPVRRRRSLSEMAAAVATA